jgi:DNA polymerase (family 10)
MEYGIATARRGWARKEDIINTLPLKELQKILNK